MNGINENIFQKDEYFESPLKSGEMAMFSIYSRLLFGIILVSLVSLFIIVQSDCRITADYSEQYINYMHLYRYPMFIGTNYMKYFLKMGNQAKSLAQVQTVSQQYLARVKNEYTSKTIFDKELNPSQIFHLYYNYTSINN